MLIVIISPVKSTTIDLNLPFFYHIKEKVFINVFEQSFEFVAVINLFIFYLMHLL
jgi:hypothetical protein